MYNLTGIHRPRVETLRHEDGRWRSRAVCQCGVLSEWCGWPDPAREVVTEHIEKLRTQVPPGYRCQLGPMHNRRDWEACERCADARSRGRFPLS